MRQVLSLAIVALAAVGGYVSHAEARHDVSPEAHHALAEQYRLGQGVPVDRERAMTLYAAAAARGHAASHHALARHHAGATGARVDAEAALRHWRAAAEAGHAPAQLELGFLFHNGRAPVPPDAGQAFRWLGAAADQGVIRAQCLLADYYRDGLGGAPRDAARAAALYQQTAASDDACATQSQLALYRAHAHGEGVPKDVPAALGWLRRAAEGGNPGAQAELGRVYRDGRGVTADPAQAQRWLFKSREGVAPHDEHGHPNGFGLDFRLRGR